MSKKQMGFTLIEIVMVLVLLGILSAVAVPKYFDLKDQAEAKASGAIAAEVQARLNGGFANELLNGTDKTCTKAREKGIEEGLKAVSESGSINTNYTVTYTPTDPKNLEDDKASFEINVKGDKDHKFTISVPMCSTNS